jgi:hypothetical protein
MPAPRRSAAALTLLAAAGLLLGACASSSTASSNGAAETTTSAPRVTAPSALDPSATGSAGAPGGAAAAPAPPCTIATAALVSGKLGFALTGPNVDRGPAATICTYDNPSSQAQSATVQITAQATPASFAAGRNGFAGHGEVVSDVSGLGDQAYSATLSVANVTNTTLVARKGSNEVLITTTAPTGAVPGLMAAILALI